MEQPKGKGRVQEGGGKGVWAYFMPYSIPFSMTEWHAFFSILTSLF